MTKRPRIAYFVYDLADQAVPRRLEQLADAGADVTLLGFSRTEQAPESVGGIAAVSLGRTREGKLVDRVLAVVRAVLKAGKWRRMIGDCDAVIARNLECLAVAGAARGRKPITYEILDIHRLLVDPGVKGRILRAIEGALVRQCQLVITSSPAFVREHLARYVGLPEVLVIENKVVDTIARPAPQPPPARVAGELWRIGWFGRLRCRRSLAFLAELARTMEGQIEIDLRGTIDLPLRDLFDEVVAATPHMRYHGRYVHADLPAIYGAAHFAWAIDFFEEGLNSSWLLPNRLYEGCANGAVPIALSDVETGKWLDRHAIGLTFASLDEIPAAIATMTPDRYRALVAALEKLPRSLFLADDAEAATLLEKVLARTDMS